MHHKLRILRSVLFYVFLMSLLFGALALLPVWAQGPERGRTAPDESFGPGVGIQALPSTTGYVIDDGDAAFTTTGTWNPFPNGYWGDSVFKAADNSGGMAKWEPDLAVGRYQVQVHWWANATFQRDDARYTVYYSGGPTSIRVNQQLKADGTSGGAGVNSDWFTLGRFPSAGGTNLWVSLDDSTTLWGTGTNVVADAVRFLAEEVWVDDNYTPAGTNDGHLWGVTAFDNIRDGLLAVADFGTVHVGPGYYIQPITITKSITLSGAGAATTFITVPNGTDTAIELLAGDVTIEGFTIGSPGPTSDYGIRNYQTAAPAGWKYDLPDLRIRNNHIYGFRYGIRLREAAGRISNNVIRNNSSYGMRLQDWPNAAGVTPGPWTVDGNILRSNGSGATDYDIWVEDTYTGTLISGNTITGSLAANEAGIYALNQAGDLILSANYIISSTRGVWTNINGTFDAQRVKLYGNTIVSGTNGVLIQYTAGGATVPQVIIGGSCANANQIYGNTDQDLRLTNYGANITATHNYWGAHTLRDIEDRIYHNWDAGGLGIVTYEPAIYVPRTIDLQVSPTSLPADGMSTATITVTVRDECNNRALRGTMIGITTSCGTVDYGFAEAEDTTQVTRTNAWTSRTAGSWSRASNGEVLEASNANRRLEWAFRGRAVSLIYAKDVGGGKAEVRIDGTLVKTIDMASMQRELRVEDVIANNLDPNVIHIIEVRPDGSGNIWVDAFRSGGVVVSGGRIVTTLTAPNSPCTAKIWATVYDGALITASSTDLYPIITSTATVVFQAADLYISKSASPASINSGQRVTYTITYGNNGVEAGTSVLVTDTLPLDFLYVSSSSVPNREPPTLIAGNPQKLVWNIGTLVAGATGTITVVAKPDQSVAWTVPVVRNNVAQISSSVPDPVAGNNSSGPVPVTVLAPASLAISAHPPAIRVSNGTITTTLRITATDGNGNPIHNIPINVTTTVGTFPASGGTALVVTTTNGVALAALASSTTVTTATVRAEVMPIGFGLPWASTQVRFIPGYPFEITSTVYPTTPIQLCGGEAVVTATIRDRWGNLVEDGTEVNFNVVQGERGDMYPRLTTTLNGIAVSTLRTKGYLFGARSLDVYILSRRETQEATHLQRVDLQEGPPHTIGLTASPSPLPVGGREAEIRALVKDCGGNPVKDGTVVTFTASSLGTIAPVTATTLNGLAYGVFQSGCTMGTAVITAASDSRVSTISLLLEPGPADLISVDAPSPSAISNCGGTATIVATAYDSCGNLVKDGTEVQFTPQYGYVTASPVRALTQNGKASTRVTAQNKTLETWPTAVEQIDVTSGSAFPGFTNLTIRPGAASKVEVMADPDSIPINGDVNLYDIVVVARVVDCSNTPVQNGTAVALRTDLGIFRESGMRLLPRLTVGGLVTGTLTSQSIAGSVTITATADSVTGTTQVRFLPGEPWLISVWGYPETIYADGQSTSLITAWVKDEFNNPVLGGVTVTLVVDFGYFQETGQVSYTTYTDGFGYVFARLVSATTPRTVLVRAIAYNSRQGYSYVFFITPPPRRYLYMPFVQRRFPS